MKYGIDIHGVITFKGYFFSKFSQRAIKNGHEIHIITGAPVDERITKTLFSNAVLYTHLFSVQDYLIENGHTILNDEDPNNLWFDDDAWVTAKAFYCERNDIDIHFDDSRKYGQYFKNIKTRYVYINDFMCPECRGTGKKWKHNQPGPCPMCPGTGFVRGIDGMVV